MANIGTKNDIHILLRHEKSFFHTKNLHVQRATNGNSFSAQRKQSFYSKTIKSLSPLRPLCFDKNFL